MKLYAHSETTEKSPLVIQDYPYGFKLRTQMRVWIETNAKGCRYCTQTMNPKTGRWNAPKKSTYSTVIVVAQDDSGKVGQKGWTSYEREGSQDRLDRLKPYLTPEIAALAQKEHDFAEWYGKKLEAQGEMKVVSETYSLSTGRMVPTNDKAFESQALRAKDEAGEPGTFAIVTGVQGLRAVRFGSGGVRILIGEVVVSKVEACNPSEALKAYSSKQTANA